VSGEYLRLRNAASERIAVDPAQLAAVIAAVGDGSISRANGREAFEAHVRTGGSIASIIEAHGLGQISDADALGTVVDEVLAANPGAVADYRAGKVQAVGFLVGQVMKATRGQANAAMAGEAVRARLDASAGPDAAS
jgi:aspartyl-tRNA(Asn)/glutamyl-tRNA(Gln) amidotransferase subunit B